MSQIPGNSKQIYDGGKQEIPFNMAFNSESEIFNGRM
jgi:hypothetical protein